MVTFSVVVGASVVVLGFVQRRAHGLQIKDSQQSLSLLQMAPAGVQVWPGGKSDGRFVQRRAHGLQMKGEQHWLSSEHIRPGGRQFGFGASVDS